MHSSSQVPRRCIGGPRARDAVRYVKAEHVNESMHARFFPLPPRLPASPRKKERVIEMRLCFQSAWSRVIRALYFQNGIHREKMGKTNETFHSSEFCLKPASNDFTDELAFGTISM